MDEDVRESRLRISRRRALGAGGAVTFGAVLTACSPNDGSPKDSRATDSSAGDKGSAAGGAASPSSPVPSATGTGTTAEVRSLLDKANTCGTSKEETQGPYWFDVDSIRRDIREDRPGLPFHLAMRVHDVSACTTGGDVSPIADCVVEIWHCDAGGAYSGFESGSRGGFGGPGPGGGGGGGGGEASDGSYSEGDAEAEPTDDGTYLRGAQVSDEHGIVGFTTIYPGWYAGRTTHIHLKVHIDKQTVLTSQLFIDDDTNDEVYSTVPPYTEHTGRTTRNDSDSIFDPSGLLTLRKLDDGYLGVVNLGIDA
jgi:protocatechuate 3,4-dioxygenase beta subunit